MKNKSFSLALARDFLGKEVKVKIDRPKGSKHPKWGWEYEVNYGFVEGVMAPDGEELDAYILKVARPVAEFRGRVVAIIHRLEDDDDKLVVIPGGEKITEKEIEEAVVFQEKWFKHEVLGLKE